MEGQLVPLTQLPSKGKPYPQDIEIYVRPLSIKEQMDMDRYGVSQAEYYQILLNGITVKGDFDKADLLFYDVHFLDLIRRLYTFDPEEKIVIRDISCSNPYCNGKLKAEFLTAELECTDFPDDIYNKKFTFSDGLTVVVSPITIEEFIDMSRQYITNKKGTLAETLIAYFAYCTKEVMERQFKDVAHMRRFLIDYYSNLYKHKDVRVLRQIENETTSKVKPIKLICPECGENMEVEVSPSMTFWQGDEDI
jgi:hypothetical protein